MAVSVAVGAGAAADMARPGLVLGSVARGDAARREHSRVDAERDGRRVGGTRPWLVAERGASPADASRRRHGRRHPAGIARPAASGGSTTCHAVLGVATRSEAGDRVGELLRLIWMSETWVSLVHRPDPLTLGVMRQGQRPAHIVEPAKDPNRREVLLVGGLDVATGEQHVVCFTMRRAGPRETDRLVAVERDTEQYSAWGNFLLRAFALGYTGRQVPAGMQLDD